jgi:hypothetical protein
MPKQRGRKSAAAKNLTVIDCHAPARPKAPADMSAQQMDIWNAVVATEPAGFFSSDALCALLADYCRHRDSCETISNVINQFDSEWLKREDGSKRFDNLLRMREREARCVLRCATKLRITNQSRYTPQSAATASNNLLKTKRPWESEA